MHQLVKPIRRKERVRRRPTLLAEVDVAEVADGGRKVGAELNRPMQRCAQGLGVLHKEGERAYAA